LHLKKLCRATVIAIHPWNRSSEPKPKAKPGPRAKRELLKLAHDYQSLLDSRRFENSAALARFLGVSQARVTQVLQRIN
jgi:hypothetical protein